MLAIEDISNKLTFDLLTLKLVSESRVTWATSVPILVFLSLSVLELSPMYATDRRQTKAASLNALALWGWGHQSSGRQTNRATHFGQLSDRRKKQLHGPQL